MILVSSYMGGLLFVRAIGVLSEGGDWLKNIERVAIFLDSFLD